MQSGQAAKGLKFRFFDKTYRIWHSGMEVGNESGGRVYFFFWHRSHKDKGL